MSEDLIMGLTDGEIMGTAVFAGLLFFLYLFLDDRWPRCDVCGKRSSWKEMERVQTLGGGPETEEVATKHPSCKLQ